METIAAHALACSPPAVAVSASRKYLLQDAAALARQLSLPLVNPEADGFPLRLCLEPSGLVLRCPGDPCLRGAVSSGYPQSQPSGHPLLRAMGSRCLPGTTVLDCTAGLGRDAWRLAQCGFQLTLIERHPVLVALLADGISRAAANPATAGVAARMRLLLADSLTVLTSPDPWPSCPDIILLDPMFPPRHKSALVKKELQLLQRLLGTNSDDGASLLAPSLNLARRRVVVKRPRLAPYLGDSRPHHSLTGRSTRYDIYLPQR